MRFTSAILASLLLFGVVAAGADDGVLVWAADPLTKVFRDSGPEARAAFRAEVARGETASFQICVRATGPVTGLKAEVSLLKRGWGPQALTPKSPRFVGYVPVDRPTQKPSKDQLRKPPADYPDPLLEVASVDVGSGQTQPIWVTVPVPGDAAPGAYHGSVVIKGSTGGRDIQVRRKLTVRVYKAAVGASRLWVTDWFSPTSAHLKISPKPDSEEFYGLLGRYARNMAEHRHNVALISALGLAEFSAAADGQLKIDFSRFDRWVRVFKEAGVIGRIEGGHIGGRKAGWESEFVVSTWSVQEGKAVRASVDPASPEAETFYGLFFPALVAHLREQGWLACYLQHLADEPIAGNIESYRAMARLLRKYAPELKVVEACHTKDLIGAIDVWVPQLNYLHADYAHYQERQKAGEEVWFYTCVYPQGEYANRFLEQPLIKTRLLHWINFRYGATGYLHWGYNQWTSDDPFTHTTRPHGGPPYLPAGDAWIVYPGENGPLDSIRFEAMRDGIADYELLCQRAEKDRPAAQELAARLVLDFDRYNTDIQAFRAARRALLKALSR